MSDDQRIYEILEEQSQRLERIENGLFGDQEMGNIGFVERFLTTETNVENNTKAITKARIYVSVIAILASAGFNTLVLVMRVFFN